MISNETTRTILALILTALILFWIKDELSGWWILIQGYFLFIFFSVLFDPDSRPGRYFR